MDFGNPWDQLWSHFDDFFVIWSTQLQCGFQSSFFSHLGVDMAPGCNARMVENIVHSVVFVRFTVLEKLEF